MPTKIEGHVIDNSRRPVANAKISLKGKVLAQSRKDGSFSVDLAKAEPRVALTFAADGYVSNTRVYNGVSRGGNVVVIWPVAYRLKFDSARDLDVELGGSRIQIPANALTGAGGEKVSGPAALRYTWFDVTSPLQRAAAPGDFSGRMRDRSVQRLNSYGIFDLAVEDLKGRALDLRRGAKVEVSIPVPRKLAPKAPKKVGFFEFELATGLWLDVGSFDLGPTLTYNGSVTRFPGPDGSTAHNCDDPQDCVCVTVQVVNDWDLTPLPNMWVTAHGPQYDSTGTTDANGMVCLLVQRNAAFTADAIGNTHGTPVPASFTSPNFSSGASDCGDSVRCPLVGTIYASLIVGMGGMLAVQFPSAIG